jgi:glycosyltransferase involved in cell wall biosynthesis
MRLGAVWIANSNANYRAIDPLNAMVRRGHDVVWPATPDGAADLRLAGCDIVHVYRRADDQTRRVLAELERGGTAITYDNDDDLTAVPKESPDYRKFGGVTGQRLFAMSVKLARHARVFTTTNEVLEERYRRAGVDRVEVIGNYLAPEMPRPRRPHDGVVIGWVAGIDHQSDVVRIRIADALERVVAKHANVRVECIGLNLALPERYRHDRLVQFRQLPERIGGFDIGIAPLANLPGNWARSDIKLKEYAASGVPWLASPIGPYRGLGEKEGGRLVPDDRWYEALDRLVTSHEERRLLGENALAWARGQTLNAVADRWERVFSEAAGGRATMPTGPGAALPPGVVVRLPTPRQGPGRKR